MKVDSFVGKLAALHYRVGDILPFGLQEAWSKTAFIAGLEMRSSIDPQARDGGSV